MKRTSRAIFWAFVGTMASMAVFLTVVGVAKGTQTLYRDSPTDKSARLYVATFNAAGGEKQNEENCTTVRDVMHRQSKVLARYWCEKGSYHK